MVTEKCYKHLRIAGFTVEYDVNKKECPVCHLQAENKLLKEALEKYGDHLGTCYANLRMGDCNCGLDQALQEPTNA